MGDDARDRRGPGLRKRLVDFVVETARQLPAAVLQPLVTPLLLAVSLIIWGAVRSQMFTVVIAVPVALFLWAARRGLGWLFRRLHESRDLNVARVGREFANFERRIVDLQTQLRDQIAYEKQLEVRLAENADVETEANRSAREIIELEATLQRALRQNGKLREDLVRARNMAASAELAAAGVPRLKDEVRRLKKNRKFAKIGKNAIVVYDIIVGWNMAMTLWPPTMSSDERVFTFLRDNFRPEIGRFDDALDKAGVAVITKEDGIYRLYDEIDAPDVIKMVAPKPAELKLEECLGKLGIADFRHAEIRCGEERDAWLVVFGPGSKDPGFEPLLSQAAGVLGLAMRS